MTNFIRAVYSTSVDFHRARGLRDAVKRTLAVLRVLFFPQLLLRMWRDRYCGEVSMRWRGLGQVWDPLHFISHRDYLVQGWPLSRRFDAALRHYRHEGATYQETFLRQVYGGAGLLLWSRHVGTHVLEIRLRCANDLRLEGDLHVMTLIDGTCVARMAFVWADGALFGQRSAPALFISRNQTYRCPELQVFRACFEQNSPHYFCFAAACGIARAEGMREIYAVRHDRQVSFRSEYEVGFRHSYSEFWETFGGRVADRVAYRIELPLQLSELGNVISKHRARAVYRRTLWADVSQHAADVVTTYRRAVQPRGAREARFGSGAVTWLLSSFLPGWSLDAVPALMVLA